VGLNTGAKGTGSNQHERKEVRFPEGTAPQPTLSDAGIDKKLSMRAQQMAVRIGAALTDF
jgi:hypothetical protein